MQRDTVGEHVLDRCSRKDPKGRERGSLVVLFECITYRSPSRFERQLSGRLDRRQDWLR